MCVCVCVSVCACVRVCVCSMLCVTVEQNTQLTHIFVVVVQLG